MNKLLILAVLSLCSCVAQKPMSEIPDGESYFTKSKSELLKVFPSIRDNNPEYLSDAKTSIPEYVVFEKQWGQPISERKEWLQYTYRIGHLLSLGYVALEDFSTTYALLEGLLISAAPTPYQTYTWEKGNYLIDVTFNEFGNKKKALYWEWKHKDVAGDYKNWLEPSLRNSWYFLMGLSSGGDKIFWGCPR